MSDTPISPLRQRMLEDMAIRNFVPDTQREYIRAVKKLAAFLGRSPDTATAEDLRAFQLHLTEAGAKAATSAGWTTSVLTGTAAMESAVRAAVAGSRIVHMPTHGFFLGRSARRPIAAEWRGGITLAHAASAAGDGKPADDGIAYAGELVDWPLSGTELVVLSACTTAQGDRSYADGLRGLPSALAVAGAERSILVLWTIPDHGAATFMVRFYEHLWHAHMDYELAFRRTKVEATAGKISGAGDPTVWQAFVMIWN